MAFSGVFSSSRAVLLKSGTKERATEELARLIARDVPGMNLSRILEYVQERESVMPTKIAEDTAIPHARIPDFPGTLAAIGLCLQGIAWEPNGPADVKLIILIVGDGNEHLEVLSWVAGKLRDAELRKSLVKSGNIRRIASILAGEKTKRGFPAVAADRRASRRLLEKSFEIASELRVSTVIYHHIPGLDIRTFSIPEGVFLYMVCSDRTDCAAKYKGVAEVIDIPFKSVNRTGQAEFAIIYLISQGLLDKNRRVISVLGEPGSGSLDTVMLSDTGKYRLFFAAGRKQRPIDLEQQVFARMLQIAGDLAGEGREGKPVGTLFVLGDSESVLKSCQQMVVNPFGGYGEQNRNVLDPGLEATIKEFSKIDGAFIIKGDGTIVCSGAFIKAENESDPGHKGFGARHTAAANISAATDAMAIALSESTRRVSVFKNGDRIMYF